MASFEVSFKSSVEKDLLCLPKSVVGRVFDRIDQLKDDPFPRQASKLQGAEHVYRIRVGNYRLVYNVDTAARRIVIQYIRQPSHWHSGIVSDTITR